MSFIIGSLPLEDHILYTFILYSENTGTNLKYHPGICQLWVNISARNRYVPWREGNEGDCLQSLAGGNDGKKPSQFWGLNTKQVTTMKGTVLEGFSLLILPLFSTFKSTSLIFRAEKSQKLSLRLILGLSMITKGKNFKFRMFHLLIFFLFYNLIYFKKFLKPQLYK